MTIIIKFKSSIERINLDKYRLKNRIQMKTLILSIFFVATIQNPISIKDIIFAYENDIDTVSNNLNSLGFEFEETDEKENIGKGVIWRYNSQQNSEIGLFVGKYCLEPKCGGIELQTYSKDLYFTLKKEAKKHGFEFDRSNTYESAKTNEFYSYYYSNNLQLYFGETKYSDGRETLYTLILRN